MNAAQLEAKIEKILASDGTKADKARALFALGCDIVDARDLIGMSYSQAHSIWRQVHGEGRSTSNRIRAAQASTGRVHGDSRTSNGAGSDPRAQRGYNRDRALYLTPAQTRYITQDGHEVIRVDTIDKGAICYNCEKGVFFDLRWLGFVHKGSKSEPSAIEDRYEA